MATGHGWGQGRQQPEPALGQEQAGRITQFKSNQIRPMARYDLLRDEETN